ncbi:hypothetical protein AU381_00315 [Sinorhizobium glycinis]|uniref:Uncharacterized protein n=2 Tax=Sinorhizobium glycinis TaxID=1472378 RepID=A0A178XYT9_9HYPH|nr:hypothetical protein AU381_00315 [Sinorhizobium glycinis]
MFLLPSDVETILEAAKPVPKQLGLVSEREAVSRCTGYDTEQLLRRLENSSKKKKAPSVGRDTAELLQPREQMKREQAARKKK